jgi:hypothetical protein
MMIEKPMDWLRFCLHFAFGAFVGFVIGVSVFGLLWDLESPLRWFLVSVSALVLGFLGGLYGDPFWERFLGSRFVRWFWYWG